MAGDRARRVGVLAIQGDFHRHRLALERLGAEVVEVRRPSHLDGLDGIILPGGESTTFTIVMAKSALDIPLRKAVEGGLPVWGTCAGAIILGRGEGRPQPRWGVIEVEVIRNAYGRQVDSFYGEVEVTGWREPFPGVFIRAPKFEVGSVEVKVLGRWKDEVVAVQQGRALATSFHPELTEDLRFHRYFLESVCTRK